MGTERADIGKVNRVRTRVSFGIDDFVDSQQLLSYIHDVQGRDQDEDCNEEEAGFNTSAKMSVERQRFGGDRMGQGCLIQVSVFHACFIPFLLNDKKSVRVFSLQRPGLRPTQARQK